MNLKQKNEQQTRWLSKKLNIVALDVYSTITNASHVLKRTSLSLKSIVANWILATWNWKLKLRQKLDIHTKLHIYTITRRAQLEPCGFFKLSIEVPRRHLAYLAGCTYLINNTLRFLCKLCRICISQLCHKGFIDAEGQDETWSNLCSSCCSRGSRGH